MTYEVTARNQHPYSAVVLVSVTFPNGERAVGTGALVNRNDILTATHVVYSEDDGGWATDIDLYFGADYNASTGRFDHPGYYELTNFSYRINGWPDSVYRMAPYDLLSESEAQYDVALIGLSVPVGDTMGWFGLASGYDGPLWAHQIGYPNGSTGMMAGEALVEAGSSYYIYEAFASDGSDILGSGSSGGPLFIYSNGNPYIIGVKSAGSSDYSLWADIGFTYDWLTEKIQANDSLIVEPAPGPTPTPPPPPLTPRPGGVPYDREFVAELTRDEHFAGGPGLDVVYYLDSPWNYDIELLPGYVEVKQLEAPYNYYFLTDIERLIFRGEVLALDVGEGQHSGSAYRMYQAAFGRTPDSLGLRYWIDQLDKGAGLLDIAYAFTVSGEFLARYGSAPSAEVLVEGYYLNVLGRAPDPSGFAYWVDTVNAGYSAAELLASFTESPENLERVAPTLSDGLWLAW